MSVNFQRMPFTMAGGAAVVIQCSGNQVVIESSTGPVEIRSNMGDTLGQRQAGQGFKGQGFMELTLTDQSGAPNTGFIVVSDDNVIDRRITGSVTFAPLGAVFANAQATVTNASGPLLTANAARKYLLIQNNGTGDVFVTLDGTAATVNNGIRLAAGGGSLEYSTVVPSGAINAIGSIANNPNIVVVQS